MADGRTRVTSVSRSSRPERKALQQFLRSSFTDINYTKGTSAKVMNDKFERKSTNLCVKKSLNIARRAVGAPSQLLLLRFFALILIALNLNLIRLNRPRPDLCRGSQVNNNGKTDLSWTRTKIRINRGNL